jgi:transcriptional regulator with XRE-family HTH domain
MKSLTQRTADRIMEVAETQGLTRAQLEIGAGLAPGKLARYQLGRRGADLGLDRLEKVADVLGVTPVSLLSEE